MSSWLQNLKVGDKVFVNWRGGSSVRTVEKITPAGNIKVNGIMFNSNGMERGSDVWSKSYLSEATPEAVKSFYERLTIQKAIKLMSETKEITLEQANAIIKVLNNTRTPQNDEVREMNWISVNDKLPEINQTVICLYNSSYEYKDNVIVCTYCGDDIWEDYYGCTTTEKITHWMLLPQPPIDKSN